jgi:hypothetical protein
MRSRHILFISTPPNNHQAVIRQWPLQRFGFLLWRSHPHVALFIGHQDNGHSLRVNRLNDRIGAVVRKPYTRCGPGTGFDFVPRSPLYSVQIPAKAHSGRSSFSANHEAALIQASAEFLDDLPQEGDVLFDDLTRLL